MARTKVRLIFYIMTFSSFSLTCSLLVVVVVSAANRT
jgi:hypothetical protein